MKVPLLNEKQIIFADMKKAYNTRVLGKGLSGTFKAP
jgi:hypothetical protein